MTDKKIVVLFLVIVVLFGFLNIKSVKNICHTIYFFNNTIIVQVRYIIIETKEVARNGYNGYLFPHSYSGDGLGATHLGLHLSTHVEKETRYIKIRAASFVSIVLYLIYVLCCICIYILLTLNKNYFTLRARVAQ